MKTLSTVPFRDTSGIEWRGGQPYSKQFQDVYFSTENGLAETEYVFLEGNHLTTRFQQCHSATFTIIETGFGTGLNFMCTARLWLATAPQNATLHFISTEKYPLTSQDFATALAFWLPFKELSESLAQNYEALIHNTTITLYDERVKLTLLAGDATEQLSLVNTEVNAWFLDGFAPAKNPEMWQDSLFQQMARLSKTGTTFATFTSAGNVRRGLQQAGFQVNKRTGYGKKREMLTGQFLGINLASKQT